MSNETASSRYQRKQIDEHRTINVDYDDWWDTIYDDFKAKMTNIGVDVEKIYFSGFWSQGDGACFEGRVEDWGKYLEHLKYDDPILSNTAATAWSLSWYHRGNYYHEQSVVFNDEIYLPDNPFDEEEDTLRHDAWDNAMQVHDLLKLTDEMKEDLRGHMKKLYRALTLEYEWLTSDEAVIEAMIANEIEPETD